MKVTCLGTGSPEAYLRRASSGYLVELGEDQILLDCGGGVFDRLLQAGHAPSDVTHLVFSHLHSDHMMDYARLVHGAWDEGGAALKVFGPRPIAEISDRFFGEMGALAFDLRARTELPQSQEVWVARGGALPRPWPAPQIVEIEAGFTLDGEGWRLSTCAATHAEPLLDCLAIRIDAGGESLVYSGDTGLNDSVAALCRDADLLIHWCYRPDGREATPGMKALTPTPTEIAKMASAQGVGRLVLTHFRKYMDAVEIHQNTLSALKTHFPGEAGIAEDLDVFTL